MRTTTLAHAALLALLAPLPGHPRPGATADPDGACQDPGDVVFRARYYRSKECREGPKGTFALGRWPAYEVAAVLKGELAVKRLLGPEPPGGLAEGEAY